jgi:MFS transporter, PAT family, beta-lactamase induction signal transducer AmpG
MLVVLLHGFAAGIPFALVTETLQAWLTAAQVSIATIGFFSYVQFPYVWKVLWAPLLDRYAPPLFGRRRGWIFVFQVILVLCICLLGLSNPAESLSATAALAVLVAFFSASQDIVIDAYRTDVVNDEERGPASSLYILGYRVAGLVSGGLAFILADLMPWSVVYLIMAAAMGIGLIATVIAPEPAIEVKPPQSLVDAVWNPLAEFFRRKASMEIFGFIVLYKVDVFIATALMTAFLLKSGFSNTDIGAVKKGVGFFATLAGTAFGGAAMVKLGMKRSLWIFGLLQGFSGLSFMTLAILGHHYPMMVVAITTEFFCSALGTAAYAAFFIAVCDKRFSATQYALLSGLMALSRTLIQGQTGVLAEAVGWTQYFLISVLSMIPGLLLLTRYDRWGIEDHTRKAKA